MRQIRDLPVGLELEAAKGRLHHRFVNVQLGCTGMLRLATGGCLTATPNQRFSPVLSRPTEGRFAIVTDVGRDAVDALAAQDERRLRRTAKSCGPDAPTLAPRFAE